MAADFDGCNSLLAKGKGEGKERVRVRKGNGKGDGAEAGRIFLIRTLKMVS